MMSTLKLAHLAVNFRGESLWFEFGTPTRLKTCFVWSAAPFIDLVFRSLQHPLDLQPFEYFQLTKGNDSASLRV